MKATATPDVAPNPKDHPVIRVIKFATNPNAEKWKPMLQLLKAVETKDAESSRSALRELAKERYTTAREDAIEFVNYMKNKVVRTSQGTLYRGVTADDMYAKELASLKPGDRFDLRTSSFSRDETVAKLHAREYFGKGFMFVIEGESKNINVGGVSLVPSEAEVLVRDKFEVEKIEGNKIYIKAID